MQHRYKIYIDGNGYGFGNIGDDGILQGILTLLKSVPEVEGITIGTKNGTGLPFHTDGVQVVPSFNAEEASRQINKSDCYLVGGGTMIGDELGTGFPLAYNVERILLSTAARKKTVLFGIGANHPMTRAGNALAGILLRYAGLVTVRDHESALVCRAIAHNHGCIHETADPAFMLEPQETVRTRKIKDLIRSKEPTIGINVVNEVWAEKKSYKEAIARACRTMYDDQGLFPIFIANEIRPGTFFDHDANRETARILDRQHLLLDPVYYSPGEMIDIISSFDLFLSMRMHGLIFAAIAGVPFTTVSRIDKVDNAMRRFGRHPPGTIHAAYAGSLVADLRLLIMQRDHIIADQKEAVRRNRECCAQNIEYLKEYIKLPEKRISLPESIRLWLNSFRYQALRRSQ